jgi:ribosomal protein S18 acetylase RimI-like enzyme
MRREMPIIIKQNNDAKPIAELNKTVQNIHCAAYPNAFKPYDFNAVLAYFFGVLKKDNWHSFLAFDGTKPIGYVVFYIKDYQENPFRYAYKSVHIDQICVESNYQGNGIGSLLMDEVAQFAKVNGIRQLELSYWAENNHAKSFYAKQGFQTMHYFVTKEL